MTPAGSPEAGQAFRVDCQHGVVLVTFLASPSAADLSALRCKADEWLARSWRLVLMDVESLRFFDSATAECLARIARMVSNRGGVLALLKPQHTVVLFLRTNGHLDRFRVYEDRATAFKELCSHNHSTGTGARKKPSVTPQMGEGAGEIELRRLVENNGFVLATIAKTLHSRGVLSKQDMQTLFG